MTRTITGRKRPAGNQDTRQGPGGRRGDQVTIHQRAKARADRYHEPDNVDDDDSDDDEGEDERKRSGALGRL
jgi:hypothetical protein